MRLVRWSPLRKGTLRGFATIELPIGLEIVDCPVLAQNGTAWATLPGKPQIDTDGRQRRGADGKPMWSAVLSWRRRELREAFSSRVVELVRDAYPEALRNDAA